MRKLGYCYEPSFTLVFVVLALISILALPAAAQSQPFDLQAAIAAAQPGDTIQVPPGTYAGPLLIDKPVILEGQGMPVIDSGGQGDVVTISAPDVTLRGFVIRNSGTSLDHENAGITGTGARVTIENNRLEDVLFGIYLKDAPGSIVRNNTVHGKDLEMGVRGDGLRLWYCADSLLEGNHVADSRDMIVWFSPNSVVRGNVVERSRYGLHFMVNENDLAENNVLRDNSVGIYLMYGDNYTVRNNLLYNNRGQSGYGLALKDVNGAVIEGNFFVSNRVGVYNDNSPLNPEAAVRVETTCLPTTTLASTTCRWCSATPSPKTSSRKTAPKCRLPARVSSKATSGQRPAAATTGATTPASTPMAITLAICPTSRRACTKI